ncbi:MAG: hypothetical protein PUP91_38840, partial [Rhizonema sp. PD37]|nr:hypothetical protein [Rhizonema sp. PD37]
MFLVVSELSVVSCPTNHCTGGFTTIVRFYLQVTKLNPKIDCTGGFTRIVRFYSQVTKLNP